MVTYAEVKGYEESILIYPAPLEVALDQRLGKIRVRSLAFSIDGDLEQAGRRSSVRWAGYEDEELKLERASPEGGHLQRT